MELDTQKGLNDAIKNLRKSLGCPICLNFLSTPVTLGCNHSFCQTCIFDAVAVKNACPICSKRITKKSCLHNPIPINNIISLGRSLIASYDKDLGGSPVCETDPASNNDLYLRSSKSEELNSRESMKPDYLENNVINKEEEAVFTATENATEHLMPAKSLMPDSKKLVNDKEPSLIQEPSNQEEYQIDEIVNILPRVWPGINKPGGIAWIKKINQDGTFNVKYIVGGGDTHVPISFIEKHNELTRSARKSRPSSSDDAVFKDSPEISRKRSRKPLDNISVNIQHNNTSGKFEQSKSISKKKARLLIEESNEFEDESSAVDQHSKLVIVSSSLSNDEASALEVFASMFSSVTLSNRFDCSTTHTIVHVDDNDILNARTMKYLQSIVAGVWVVSAKWLVDCISSERILPEKDYEVQRNSKAVIQKACMRARISMKQILSGMKERLFNNVLVIVYGSFPSPGPPKSDLEHLLEKSGSSLCKSLDDFSTRLNKSPWKHKIIVCAEKISHDKLFNSAQGRNICDGITIVNPMWVLDCITNYHVMDPTLDCYCFA